MGKLIFADSVENFKLKLPNWNVNTDPSFYSIAFTDDGYLLTHGKQFALSLVGGDVSDQVQLSLVNGNEIKLSGKDIAASSVVLPVYSILGVENNPVTVSGTGEITVQHALSSGDKTTTLYGSSVDYSISIPKFYVDAYGHVTHAENGATKYLNQVKQNVAASDTDYYILGGSNSSGSDSDETYLHSSIKFNGGTLYADSFNEGGKALINKYVQIANIGDGTGKLQADAANPGIVKLSDRYSGEDITNLNAAEGGTAATPYAVAQALDAAKLYSKDLFASNDAMVFMGTINANGVIQSHNSIAAAAAGVTNIDDGVTSISSLQKHLAGWTFKFTESGSFTLDTDRSWIVESGDMLICTRDGSSIAAAGYDVIQVNIENAVVSTGERFDQGIIYATGTGRTVASFAYPTEANKALMYDGSSLKWGDMVNTWRTISLEGQEILSGDTTSNVLNFKAGTGISINNTDGSLTFTNSSPLSAATALSIQNNKVVLASYNPSSEANPVLNFGGAIVQASISDGVINVEHKTSSVTASTTADLYKIGFDSYGHITAATKVTTLDIANKNAFTVSQGNNSVSYNNSEAVGLAFANGTDISLTGSIANNILTITPAITHKYKKVSFQNSTSTNAIGSSGDTSAEITFKAADANTEFSFSNNVVTLKTINTWRNVEAFRLDHLNDGNSGNDVATNVLTSIDTYSLKFSSDFAWDNNEINIMWTEINGDSITYHA